MHTIYADIRQRLKLARLHVYIITNRESCTRLQNYTTVYTNMAAIAKLGAQKLQHDIVARCRANVQSSARQRATMSGTSILSPSLTYFACAVQSFRRQI